MTPVMALVVGGANYHNHYEFETVADALKAKQIFDNDERCRVTSYLRPKDTGSAHAYGVALDVVLTLTFQKTKKLNGQLIVSLIRFKLMNDLFSGAPEMSEESLANLKRTSRTRRTTQTNSTRATNTEGSQTASYGSCGGGALHHNGRTGRTRTA